MLKLIFALVGGIRSVIFCIYNPKNSFHDVSSGGFLMKGTECLDASMQYSSGYLALSDPAYKLQPNRVSVYCMHIAFQSPSLHSTVHLSSHNLVGHSQAGACLRIIPFLSPGS